MCDTHKKRTRNAQLDSTMNMDLNSMHLRLVRGDAPDVPESGLQFPADPSQRLLLNSVLQALMLSLDAKDSYTRGHSDRVSHLARKIAIEMQLPQEEIELITTAGLVHDLGKIGVPENVLRKPTRLTDAEFDTIKLHPEIGRKIVQEIPLMFQAVPAVLHHHEKWDGTGYPRGLKGEEIPLYARILAVADAFDAMSSPRCYKDPIAIDRVLAEMKRCSATQFDPSIVDALLKIDLSDYVNLLATHMAGKEAAA
jgi:HD-GYP domain-containing protein (c-di-GMP phosphodiesterase class II)